MDDTLFNIHMKAAEAVGKDKACRNKTGFQTETAAYKAADAHNRWEGRKHDVEVYPCPFCRLWHLGGIWPVEKMLETIQKHEEKSSVSQV